MPYSQRFDEAFLYAHQLHRQQHRKSTGIPYVTHLLAVAALVGEHGGSEVQVIAALLHDAVEDQGGAGTGAEIEARFGPEVARIVYACSDTDVEPKPPWRPRKEAYIRHLWELPEDVLLVSIADKLHNARTILMDLYGGNDVWKRFSGGKEGTLWYYRSLQQVYSARMQGPMVMALQDVLEKLHLMAGVPWPPLDPAV